MHFSKKFSAVFLKRCHENLIKYLKNIYVVMYLASFRGIKMKKQDTIVYVDPYIICNTLINSHVPFGFEDLKIICSVNKEFRRTFKTKDVYQKYLEVTFQGFDIRLGKLANSFIKVSELERIVKEVIPLYRQWRIQESMALLRGVDLFQKINVDNIDNERIINSLDIYLDIVKILFDTTYCTDHYTVCRVTRELLFDFLDSGNECAHKKEMRMILDHVICLGNLANNFDSALLYEIYQIVKVAFDIECDEVYMSNYFADTRKKMLFMLHNILKLQETLQRIGMIRQADRITFYLMLFMKNTIEKAAVGVMCRSLKTAFIIRANEFGSINVSDYAHHKGNAKFYQKLKEICQNPERIVVF